MDPVTTAIIAAVAAGAAAGAGQVAEQAIVDGYNRLKAAIRQNFGADSEVAQAVEKVEAKPESAGRRETLKEEVAAAQADQDAELRQAAEALLEQLKAQPGGAQHVQQIASGSYIAQASHGGMASVTVGQSKTDS